MQRLVSLEPVKMTRLAHLSRVSREHLKKTQRLPWRQLQSSRGSDSIELTPHRNESFLHSFLLAISHNEYEVVSGC